MVKKRKGGEEEEEEKEKKTNRSSTLYPVISLLSENSLGLLCPPPLISPYSPDEVYHRLATKTDNACVPFAPVERMRKIRQSFRSLTHSSRSIASTPFPLTNRCFLFAIFASLLARTLSCFSSSSSSRSSTSISSFSVTTCSSSRRTCST